MTKPVGKLFCQYSLGEFYLLYNGLGGILRYVRIRAEGAVFVRFSLKMA
jgi:hypothetical protein